jgi:hypothetical protein
VAPPQRPGPSVINSQRNSVIVRSQPPARPGAQLGTLADTLDYRVAAPRLLMAYTEHKSPRRPMPRASCPCRIIHGYVAPAQPGAKHNLVESKLLADLSIGQSEGAPRIWPDR